MGFLRPTRRQLVGMFAALSAGTVGVATIRGARVKRKPAAQAGVLFSDPRVRPLSATGAIQPGCNFTFYLTTATTLTAAYADAGLTMPLPNPIVADGSGRFVPIYLDPAVQYRVQLRDANNNLLEDIDPYWVPSGNSRAGAQADPFPHTEAEMAAGVIPKNYSYPPGDVKRYGAQADGTTDDTTAVQTAVKFCIGANMDMTVSGLCLLSAPVNVDRQVDGAAYDNYFKITTANGGGFVVNSAIAMFSSSIPVVSAPVSQLVLFDAISFIAESASHAAYVLEDSRFLRVQFNRCSFDKIKCLDATKTHTQSIYFFGCQARRWTGVFFSSRVVSFDIRFNGMLAEAGDRFAVLAFPVGSSFSGTIEGMKGTALRYYGAQGFNVTGYFEQNDCDIDGSAFSTEANYGVAIVGGYFAHKESGGYKPSSKYSIKWGKCVNAVSEANYCTSYLHELTPESKVRINDEARGEVTNRPGYLTGTYNAPAFAAYAANAQTLIPGEFAKILFGSLEFDTNANFSGSRFTPSVPGYYTLSATVKFGASLISRAAIGLYKNGAEIARLADQTVAGAVQLAASHTVYLNGSTDYLEIWGFAQGTGLTTVFNSIVDTSRISAAFARP